MEKRIASYEDLQHDRIIYFVFSDEGRHRISSYSVGDQQVTVLFEWTGFGWTPATLITGIGMVGDILIWCEGLDKEIRALNLTRKNVYDRVKNSDNTFITLLKRPPLLSLTASRTASAVAKPNLVNDHSFTFSYRYVYSDGEVSVLAPWSEPAYLPFKGEGEMLKDVTVDGPSEPIPPLVSKIEFVVKRDNETTWYSVKTSPVPETLTLVSDYKFTFDNSALGNTIADDDALRIYDAIWPAKDLTVARNRLFYANYAEGYNELGAVSMTIRLTSDGFAVGDRILKPDTTHRLGVVYYDEYGRNMGVITQPEWALNTESFSGSLIRYFLKADIDLVLTPPSWAKYWRLVKSRDMVFDFFLQGFGIIASKQRSVPEYPDETLLLQQRMDGGPIDGVNISAESVVLEMFVDISSLIDRGVGYVFEQGDVLDIHYRDRADSLIKRVRGISIMEQQGSLLKIPLTPELMARHPAVAGEKGFDYRYGVRFSIYRQQNTASFNDFFETSIGGKLEPGVNTLSVELKGDTWILPSDKTNPRTYLSGETEHITVSGPDDFPTDFATIPVFPYMEAMSPWDKYYTRWDRDRGRISTVLPDNIRKKVLKPNYERFSNKYIAGTQINGISSFEGLNEKELPMENGPINKLALVSNTQSEGTVLLAIQQNETESQYLGEVQFRDTQGETVGAVSDAVIGSTQTLRGGFGTINPESFAYHDGRAYWWDATKGEVIRHSIDGLTPLAKTYKMRTFFERIKDLQRPYGNRVKVYGGFEPETQEYVMTFSPLIEGSQTLFEGFTIAFSERVQGFVQYSYKPEGYCKSNTKFVSFLGGKLYLHGQGPVHNNFYGEQFTSAIRFVSNANPDLPKVWQSYSTEGTKAWVPRELKNERGQASYVKKEWFENREGVFYAAIRRNINTRNLTLAKALNRGEELRSQYLDITIELDSKELERLDRVNVEFRESSGHTTIQ